MRARLLLAACALLVAGCTASSKPVATPSSRTPVGPTPPAASLATPSVAAPSLATTVPVPPDAQRARVRRVIDGDTYRLVGEGSGPLSIGRDTRVRLIGIDAPEVGFNNQPTQCFAAEATAYLRRLTPIGAVVLVAAQRDARDPYGRTLLDVWTHDGRFVGESVVREGYGRRVAIGANTRYDAAMRRAESAARSERRGLWGTCAG